MAERFKGMRNVKDTNLNRVTHQTWYNKQAIKDLTQSIPVPERGLVYQEAEGGWELWVLDPSVNAPVGSGSIHLGVSASGGTDGGPAAPSSVIVGNVNKIPAGSGSGFSYIVGAANQINAAQGYGYSNYILGVENKINSGYGTVAIGLYNEINADVNGFVVLMGMNNRASGTGVGGALGTALDVRGRGEVAVGIANVPWTGSNTASNRPMFVVGTGTSTTPGGPWAPSVQRNGFEVLANNKIIGPNMTAAQIDGHADGKILINREWIEANGATSVPATASSPGNPGQYAFGGGFFYICVATNSWERVATAAW